MKPNRQGETPFYYACKHNKYKVVQLLITDHRINMNVGNVNENTTPFGIVCEKGLYIELVDLLLTTVSDSRIDFNRKGGRFTPFMTAISHGQYEVVQLLMRDPKIDITVCLE